MPGGDGTGPNGLGPMTGRRLGYCAGFSVPGFMNPGFGLGRAWRRGFGRGFGRGFRWRARFFQPQIAEQVIPIQQATQPLTKSDEKQLLEEEKQYLQDELEAIKNEMQEIEKRLKELK